jgi:hypothetical protein
MDVTHKEIAKALTLMRLLKIPDREDRNDNPVRMI